VKNHRIVFAILMATIMGLIGAFYAQSAPAATRHASAPAAITQHGLRGQCGGPSASMNQLIGNLMSNDVLDDIGRQFNIRPVDDSVDSWIRRNVGLATMARTATFGNKGCSHGAFFGAHPRTLKPGDKAWVLTAQLKAKFPNGFSLTPRKGWTRKMVCVKVFDNPTCTNPLTGTACIWVWVPPTKKVTPPAKQPGVTPAIPSPCVNGSVNQSGNNNVVGCGTCIGNNVCNGTPSVPPVVVVPTTPSVFSASAMATASASANATATVNCPAGSTTATATATASGSASASGSATAMSTVSQQDAQNKANAQAQANANANAQSSAVQAQAQANAQSNAQASASAKCISAPPVTHFTNVSCVGFEEIFGGESMIVKCDVSNDNGASISLDAHSNDGNSRVSGINCYSQGGTPSCQGNGQFEFRVTGINAGSTVLSSSVTVTASSNGVSKTWTSDPFPVDQS
jgi:hypothetical protein